MLKTLLSGGQTGVDRAVLDVALARGLTVGGGCPGGRGAEDGMTPDRYPLTETPERNDRAGARRDAKECDGTLILNQGALFSRNDRKEVPITHQILTILFASGLICDAKTGT
jgi:hypothetical protein